LLAPEFAGVTVFTPLLKRLLVEGLAPVPNRPLPAVGVLLNTLPVADLAVAFGGGPAGVVEPREPKLKVFVGAGVVEPAGALVAAVFGESPPPKLLAAGVFRPPNIPPPAFAVAPPVLKSEGAEVPGVACFVPNKLPAALPVPKRGVEVPEVGLDPELPAPKNELGCAFPVLAPNNDCVPEVVAPEFAVVPNREGAPDVWDAPKTDLLEDPKRPPWFGAELAGVPVPLPGADVNENAISAED